MTSQRLWLVPLAMVAGCYSEQASAWPQYPEPVQPAQYSGPPGMGMYPDQVPQDPSAYGGQQYGDPSQQYSDPTQQYSDTEAMGPVTDTEIDATLEGYGTWQEDPDYGRVWRPDATTVGVDFTPYETCGSWVWTTYGWTYTCDYGWGWLPFHYGQWAWFDDGYWGWVPGYEWSPAWVDWRSGGGYVGWRPREPVVHVRDHRHPVRESQWRFAAERDFAKPHIKVHEYPNPAEGIRVTSATEHLPLRPTSAPVRVTSVMQPRLTTPAFQQNHPLPQRPAVAHNPNQPQPIAPGQRGYVPPPAAIHPGAPQQPAYRAPQQAYYPPQRQYPTYRAPQQTYYPPARQYPAYHPPAQSYYPTYRPPAQTYRPPVQTYHPAAPSYHPTYSAPSYHPSAPSYSGGGYHSSGSSGGYHSSGSSGGGFHSSGGGHHR